MIRSTLQGLNAKLILIQNIILKRKKMVSYRIVKHCGRCKERFVVHKSESRKYFCDACGPIVEKLKE